MNMEAQGRYGVTLVPTGSKSSYRNLDQQWDLYNLYKSGRGNLAAYPGTSNHGWGLAVDLASMEMRKIVDQIGEKYGWAKKWSDAPSEWWHLKFRKGVWKGQAPYGRRVVKRGQWGADVRKLKRRLKRHGAKISAGGLASPWFTKNTTEWVKAFQKKKGFKADGIVGPKTWHALLK